MLDLKQNKGQECRAFLTMLVVIVIEHHTVLCRHYSKSGLAPSSGYRGLKVLCIQLLGI